MFGQNLFGLGGPQEEVKLLRKWQAEEAAELDKAAARGDAVKVNIQTNLLDWLTKEIERREGFSPPPFTNIWTGSKGGGFFGEDVLAPIAPPADIKKTLKAMSKLPMPLRRSSASVIEWLRKPEALRRAVSFIGSAMRSLKKAKSSADYRSAANAAMSAAILAGRASEEDSALASRIINTAKAILFASLKRQKKI
jgi:hypothetical protein